MTKKDKMNDKERAALRSELIKSIVHEERNKLLSQDIKHHKANITKIIDNHLLELDNEN